LILKWLVIPIALLGVGVYLVGPQIGATVEKTGSKTPVSATTGSTPTVADNSDDQKVPRHGEPQVQIVSVQRGSSFRANQRSGSYRKHSGRKKRHRKSSSTSDSGAAPTEIPMSGGGGQGASDGGGSTGTTGGGGGGTDGLLFSSKETIA
jgi:hypothetical protein